MPHAGHSAADIGIRIICLQQRSGVSMRIFDNKPKDVSPRHSPDTLRCTGRKVTTRSAGSQQFDIGESSFEGSNDKNRLDETKAVGSD
jgi:hypothetical protein